jgi:O-succinylbenzoic acid--CoA ligase
MDVGATALESNDRSWTYGELDEAVERRTVALDSGGLTPGRVVPLVVRQDAESVIDLLAYWRAGVTPAPLNSRLSLSEHKAASIALTGIEASAQVVLWTSGTSGQPRGVAISIEALRANARASAERLGLSRGDTWLASLSPAHVGGLALITRSLLLGSRLLVLGSFNAERVNEHLSEITHVSLVPTQLSRILDARNDEPPPETLRCVLVGGAQTPKGLLDRAISAGWPIALTYGLTELTSQVATAPPDLTQEKPGTVGAPLSGVEVRLDQGGEIHARGDTIASGYVGDCSESFTDGEGWHRTGDLGSFDSDGHLWVTGRRTDRIVTGGVTVDAAEVEEVLRSHPTVADACVVGIPDEEWGERVGAWVEPDGEGATSAVLDTYLRELLSSPKIPRSYHFGTPVPRNANGKLDRTTVRQALS